FWAIYGTSSEERSTSKAEPGERSSGKLVSRKSKSDLLRRSPLRKCDARTPKGSQFILTLLQKGTHPRGLLKPEFAGEELEQLHRKKIIQLLNVTLPQGDNAELVSFEQCQFPFLSVNVLGRVEPPIFNVAVAYRDVEVRVGLLFDGQASLI